MAQPFAEPCSRGVITSEPCPRELGHEMAPARRRLVLAACVLASSMAFIDGSVLTVALPRLRAAIGLDLAAVQWVVNGYVLALASLTLVGGALADARGKSRILALGCLLFGAASVACALAPSAAFLIAARIVQGVGAALLVPASLALIGATYPKAERSRAIGAWAAASALTTAAGPVLGGWLTETYGWQAIFWINPPIAVLVVGLLWAFAPADIREPRRFDVVGAVVIAFALGALAWSLSEVGQNSGHAAASLLWSDSEVVVVGVLGVAGLVGYAAWERTTDHSMTPPRLARNRLFVALNAGTLLLYVGLSIMFFLLPFDLLDRRELTPTEAGLTFLPFTLGVGLLSEWFGARADVIGTRTMLVAGPCGAAAAFTWMAFGQNASLIAGVIGPMALLGISFAALIAPLTASVMSSVGPADEGLASGVNNAASRVAQLMGVAIAAGIGSLTSGYRLGLLAAAITSLAGGVIMVSPVGVWPDKALRR